MYTTSQAIDLLLKSKMGLTLKMLSNENIHIFKDIDGRICRGEYGDGLIVELEYGLYASELWKVDSEGSCYTSR